MNTTSSDVKLSDVVEVYSGPELSLWQMLMGEQIHMGGRKSSLDLLSKAGIEEKSKGLDICCCLGAGMRFLTGEKDCEMTGIDATPNVINLATNETKNLNLTDKHEYVVGDATKLPFADNSFDFIWGEDAWCYVEDKDKLISEAFRVLKPGGKIAFTDWILGSEEMEKEEILRVLGFMKFLNLQSRAGYEELMKKYGFCEVQAIEQEGMFAYYCQLYQKMLTEQLATDALKILGGNNVMLDAIVGEMSNMENHASSNRLARGMFIATKPKGGCCCC